MREQTMIAGVGPNARVSTNAAGGKQSATAYRADLLPPFATLRVAGILKHGADSYGVDNWRKIPQADHLNHAMIHLLAHLAGDVTDDHLGHAACRLLFAIETTDAQRRPRKGRR